MVKLRSIKRWAANSKYNPKDFNPKDTFQVDGNAGTSKIKFRVCKNRGTADNKSNLLVFLLLSINIENKNAGNV
jgi:hypothetical protein